MKIVSQSESRETEMAEMTKWGFKTLLAKMINSVQHGSNKQMNEVKKYNPETRLESQQHEWDCDEKQQ